MRSMDFTRFFGQRFSSGPLYSGRFSKRMLALDGLRLIGLIELLTPRLCSHKAIRPEVKK